METEARLGRLEQEVRRLRIVAAFCVLGFVSMGTLAMTPHSDVQDVVQARRFELVNGDGQLLAHWEGREPGWLGAELRFYGADTTQTILSLGAPSSGAVLQMSNDVENQKAFFTNNSLFFERNGETVAELNTIEGYTFLELRGALGHTVLGNTRRVESRTGAETTFPVSTLTLYDADGNVRAQLPR